MSGKEILDNKSTSSSTVLKIFTYIGGALIFFGVVFLIAINWLTLNNFIKIFTTLGVAAAAYITAVLLHYAKKEAASSVFFMLCALILPIGLLVTLYLYGLNTDELRTTVIISAICLAIFLATQVIFPRTILILFTIIFASIFTISFIDFIVSKNGLFLANVSTYEYLTLGLSYFLLGYYLDFDKKYLLSGPLYFFGTFFLLGASYYQGGFFYHSETISMWQITTGILILSAFLISVPLKSKTILYVSALFLIGYLIDSSTRFADIFGHLGWPLILIIAGLLFIVLGYVVMHIHQRINRKLNN